MNGVNQILVIAVGALILLGLMGAVGTGEGDGIFGKVVEKVNVLISNDAAVGGTCLLYTSPSPRDATLSRMPSSA